jgi:hypothetical protein
MYGTQNHLHSMAWSLRRAARLSPMQAVMRELKRRGVPLQELDALEAFGGDGSRHTMDYAGRVRRVDVWEFDPAYLPGLRRNLPLAEVTIGDSFAQIRLTERRYGLLVVDTPASLFGPDNRYCEHFEFFNADMLRALAPDAVILLNIRPATESDPALTPEQMSRRGKFYRTDSPATVSVEQMVAVYRELLQAGGFTLEWHFHRLRTVRSQVHYLALKVRRTSVSG